MPLASESIIGATEDGKERWLARLINSGNACASLDRISIVWEDPEASNQVFGGFCCQIRTNFSLFIIHAGQSSLIRVQRMYHYAGCREGVHGGGSALLFS